MTDSDLKHAAQKAANRVGLASSSQANRYDLIDAVHPIYLAEIERWKLAAIVAENPGIDPEAVRASLRQAEEALSK